MDHDIENWLNLAEYDLATAEALLVAGRTLYVVFTCQQAVEKALKALVAARLGAHPPRTHDLAPPDRPRVLADANRRLLAPIQALWSTPARVAAAGPTSFVREILRTGVDVA